MKKRNLSAKKKIHNFYLEKLNNPRIKKIYGFQFHPESFLTENGDILIKKILSA